MILAFSETPALPQSGPVLFTEVPAARSGIRWTHENATSDPHYLPETMGAGVAVFDYDNDGWLDLYFVNSGPSDFFQPTTMLQNALYRNKGDGTFEDVTKKAGVAGGTFGMGAAAADYDNDGNTDLLVTGYGRAVLYRNRGDGVFQDVTRQAGLDVADGWTTSAAWFDADGDGDLDLVICRYVQFSKEEHISCGLNPLGKSYYCVPRVFAAARNLLLGNNGDGTFSRLEGNPIDDIPGKSLGVVATDVNNDRRLDLFIANDTLQDFLFLNRGEGKWEEAGIFAGVGYSIDGLAQSGMGVDAGDFDADGRQDLVVTNIDHQFYGLFKNLGGESFDDATQAWGLGEATFLLSGWGLKFFDFDNDGDQDLIIANGHPDDMITAYSANVNYRNPLLLFENRDNRFHNISASAGPIFQRPLSARGLALGDYDNDGFVDVVISGNGEAPLLLHNTTPKRNHWLGVRLRQSNGNSDAVGARITWSAGGKRRSMLVTGGGSYLSSHDPRRVLGLGPATSVEWVEVLWPGSDGARERFNNLEVDRYVELRQGSGTD